MSRFCLVLFAVFAVCFSIDANAASAVAYGKKTVHASFESNLLKDAAKSALEACSHYDDDCKIIEKCQNLGFGAVAIEKIDGKITSIGAACGYDNAEDVKKEALRICSIENVKDDCKLSSFYKDE
jgi:hypothetical protein